MALAKFGLPGTTRGGTQHLARAANAEEVKKRGEEGGELSKPRLSKYI